MAVSAPAVRRAAQFAVRTPAGLLAIVWAGALALYAFGPIIYERQPRPSTWLFIGICLIAFAVGGWVGSRARAAEPIRPGTGVNGRLELIVRAAALIGLFGAACIAIDKLVLSGLDFSQGVQTVRTEREVAVGAGTSDQLHRSALLYLGYVTFTFSVASYLTYLLRGEVLRLSTTWLAFGGLASIFVYSYVYGSRGPLWLVLGMACGAIVVRLLSRQPALPRGRTGRILFGVFVLLVLAYSTWVLSERFAASGQRSYSAMEQTFAVVYDARIPALLCTTQGVPTSVQPQPTASEAERPSAYEQFCMQVISNLYYFTHEIPMLDRALSYEGPLGPYYGAYQLYVPQVFVHQIAPQLWNMDAVMFPQMKAANIYGWFPTAWGGMYLDFGIFGGIVAVLLCGWLAGLVYRRALVDRSDGARLLMCWVVAGIVATPLQSMFTMNISLPTLLSLLVTAFFLGTTRPRSSHDLASARTGTPAHAG